MVLQSEILSADRPRLLIAVRDNRDAFQSIGVNMKKWLACLMMVCVFGNTMAQTATRGSSDDKNHPACEGQHDCGKVKGKAANSSKGSNDASAANRGSGGASSKTAKGAKAGKGARSGINAGVGVAAGVGAIAIVAAAGGGGNGGAHSKPSSP
jgi:hypothetical protein